MKKEERTRYLLFVIITMVGVYYYQFYHNYQNDKLINEAIAAHNKRNNELKSESLQWQLAAEYWRAMYYGVEHSNNQLEEQIDFLSNYWSKECLKLSDELFDIKNQSVKIDKIKK